MCKFGVIRLNKYFNCDHLSRENGPSVRMSAICLEVFTYFISIPGSIVQVNTMSLVMVELQPFMVMLITASLSSIMNRDVRWLEVCIRVNGIKIHDELLHAVSSLGVASSCPAPFKKY